MVGSSDQQPEVVLGGGAALAASQLRKNSVGTKQLKKNSVTTARIKNGAVTLAKVSPETLGSSRVRKVRLARQVRAMQTRIQSVPTGFSRIANRSSKRYFAFPSG